MNKKQELLSVLINIEEDLLYLYKEKEKFKQMQLSLPSLNFNEKPSQTSLDPVFKRYIILEEKIDQLIKIKNEELDRVYEEMMKYFDSLKIPNKRMVKLLKMRYMDGMTFSEIGEVLCITRSAASSLHAKALEYIPIAGLEEINRNIVNVYTKTI